MQIKNLFSERADRLQISIAWFIYFFVNVIFCIKYNPFEIIHPLYFIVGYPLIVIGIYKATAYTRLQQKNRFFLLLAFAVLLFALFLWHYIDRWSVKVDRWSALAFWSENLKNGIFPYGTPTHLGGYASPFPVWQLFHFPFYLLGDTAYGQWFCLLVFFVALFRWRTKMNIGGILILLALSPGFWWEIAVRSDLLCNMLLVFVFLTAQFYYSDFWNKHKISTAAITGLFLCTRLFVAIPLFLYFFPKFLKFTDKEKIGFALTTIACFIIPFLPFLFGEHSILNHPEYNPFILQMCQGNNWETCQGNVWLFASGCIPLLRVAFIWKRMRDMYFLAGLFLFVLILAVGIRIGIEDGLHSVIFDAKFDKSYFNVCIPFFLFFIHEIKKRTFDYSNYKIDY
jgi:hypothetical protein